MCFYLLRQKVLKVVKIIETPVANQSLKNHFFNFEGFFFFIVSVIRDQIVIAR